MTGQDLLKEILLHVPELRGAVDVVRRWLNQAIRDIEGAEDWEFMINEYTKAITQNGDTITSPLNTATENLRMKKPFKVVITHSGTTYATTLVEPFSEFKKLDFICTNPVFCGYENE